MVAFFGIDALVGGADRVQQRARAATAAADQTNLDAWRIIATRGVDVGHLQRGDCARNGSGRLLDEIATGDFATGWGWLWIHFSTGKYALLLGTL
jgi:hypothetical protein